MIINMLINAKEGFTYNGHEEVNSLIKCGGKVISIEPGLLMRKQDGDNDYLYISGFSVKVIVDDSCIDKSPETA